MKRRRQAKMNWEKQIDWNDGGKRRFLEGIFGICSFRVSGSPHGDLWRYLYASYADYLTRDALFCLVYFAERKNGKSVRRWSTGYGLPKESCKRILVLAGRELASDCLRYCYARYCGYWSSTWRCNQILRLWDGVKSSVSRIFLVKWTFRWRGCHGKDHVAFSS